MGAPLAHLDPARASLPWAPPGLRERRIAYDDGHHPSHREQREHDRHVPARMEDAITDAALGQVRWQPAPITRGGAVAPAIDATSMRAAGGLVAAVPGARGRAPGSTRGGVEVLIEVRGNLLVDEHRAAPPEAEEDDREREASRRRSKGAHLLFGGGWARRRIHGSHSSITPGQHIPRSTSSRSASRSGVAESVELPWDGLVIAPRRRSSSSLLVIASRVRPSRSHSTAGAGGACAHQHTRHARAAWASAAPRTRGPMAIARSDSDGDSDSDGRRRRRRRQRRRRRRRRRRR